MLEDPFGSFPEGITTGPDGALWFTDGGVRIGRMTTAGAVTVYAIPTPTGAPYGITTGPDGALWFTEPGSSKIGRISTNGMITEFSLAFDSSPVGITTGPDGALWFTESNSNKIGRITTSGVITEYAVSGNPQSIMTGPDGALWFTEVAGRIGRISTSGEVNEYPVGFNPIAITAGPDGTIWFSGRRLDFSPVFAVRGAIGRIEFPPPVHNVQVDVQNDSLSLASNGSLTVMIFGAVDFDAAQIDVGSVRFAGASAWQYSLVDVNHDGRLDLQLKFRTQDTILDEIYSQLLEDDFDADGVLDSTRQMAEVAVTGQTLDSVLFSGSDDINLFLSGRALRELLDDLFA
jgi:hypothetical protein